MSVTTHSLLNQTLVGAVQHFKLWMPPVMNTTDGFMEFRTPAFCSVVWNNNTYAIAAARISGDNKKKISHLRFSGSGLNDANNLFQA